MAPSLLSSPPAPSSELSTKKTLYILSEFHPEAVRHAESIFHCIHHTSPEAKNWRQNATAILIKDYAITAADLAQAPQLQAIGKQGVGVDQIDLAACAAANVKVINTPGVNASAVAEMTLALAFSVARNIPKIWSRMFNAHEAIRKETINGMLLSGKTLGVIGMGNIGQAVARMFHAGLNCPILAYDPHAPSSTTSDGTPIPPRGWESVPHQRVDTLDEILTQSDIVTVHVPLTPGTKGMISHVQLAQMKRSAILLNTARGGIVDEDALTQALEKGQIWGAGFDCHVQEPPTRERYERLWSCGGFVGTPHIAAATDETQIATTNAAIDGVYRRLCENESVVVNVA